MKPLRHSPLALALALGSLLAPAFGAWAVEMHLARADHHAQDRGHHEHGHPAYGHPAEDHAHHDADPEHHADDPSTSASRDGDSLPLMIGTARHDHEAWSLASGTAATSRSGHGQRLLESPSFGASARLSRTLSMDPFGPRWSPIDHGSPPIPEFLPYLHCSLLI